MLINKLQKILNDTVDNKRILGTVVSIDSDSFHWSGFAGNLHEGSQFFIASTTKLFTTSLILKLVNNGKLNLDDRISKYLPSDLILGLHIYKDVDYTKNVTIKNLLAHTSGLPDYFQQKGKNGRSLHDDIIAGNDKAWNFETVIELSKTMKPKFKPGEKRKAFYSDTNYQILGRIIESTTSKTLKDVYDKFIIEPLGLKNTYLFDNISDPKPAPIYFKSKPLNIPKAMSSFGPDGGIVSTSADLMKFIKAFFSGALFPKEYLSEMQNWNKIFFPLEYGVGVMRFKLPRIFSPFKAYPELIGHSGLSGAFAFFCPELKTYLTGTVNQVSSPGISFRLMLKLLRELQKIN